MGTAHWLRPLSTSPYLPSAGSQWIWLISKGPRWDWNGEETMRDGDHLHTQTCSPVMPPGRSGTLSSHLPLPPPGVRAGGPARHQVGLHAGAPGQPRSWPGWKIPTDHKEASPVVWDHFLPTCCLPTPAGPGTLSTSPAPLGWVTNLQLGSRVSAIPRNGRRDPEHLFFQVGTMTLHLQAQGDFVHFCVLCVVPSYDFTVTLNCPYPGNSELFAGCITGPR